MRSLIFLVAVITGTLAGPTTGWSAPMAKPANLKSLYDQYARSNPTKGMNQNEFEKYLVDHLSSDPETARQLADLYVNDPKYFNVMNPKIEDAWTKILNDFSSPDAGVLDRAQFGSYLKKYPPGSSLPSLTSPASSSQAGPTAGILAKITGGLIQDGNLHINKSSSQPGSSGLPGGIDPGPAQFNWTKAAGSSSVFSIDGALSYNYQPKNVDWLYIVPGVEAHTSTASSAQQDSISAGVNVKAWFDNSDANGLFAGNLLSLAPAYETDRKKDTETYGGGFFYTPILNLPGMENYQRLDFWRSHASPADQNVYPGFSWTAAVGLEGGYATQSPNVVFRLQNDYARIAGKLHADLYISPRFDIAVDFTHRTFLTGQTQSFEYVEVSPTFYLDSTQDDPKKQNFALGMTFKYGKTTPQFQKVDSISLWFGVKF